ncbi:hypothetical protein [Paenisporosarcina sp. OV554]|uniref:hypothetical protein n=1 Tax=Paenisporosarcina sp. OV554 TaxID=2135694 RepID=UPI001304EA8D|nr:hypothetical protein [Paenisporosarcina sp. OV554]
MDFHNNRKNSRFLNIIQSSDLKSFEGIKLELLYVHDDSDRKKGLASYYFCKLREYAIQVGAKQIRVKAIADDKKFKKGSKFNALNQKELENFYIKKDTPEMVIKIYCNYNNSQR